MPLFLHSSCCWLLLCCVVVVSLLLLLIIISLVMGKEKKGKGSVGFGTPDKVVPSKKKVAGKVTAPPKPQKKLKKGSSKVKPTPLPPPTLGRPSILTPSALEALADARDACTKSPCGHTTRRRVPA